MQIATHDPVSRPIERPAFRNERIRDFGLWLQDNLPELESYIASLEASLNDGIKEDMFTLLCVQHDIELLRVNQERMAEAG